MDPKSVPNLFELFPALQECVDWMINGNDSPLYGTSTSHSNIKFYFERPGVATPNSPERVTAIDLIFYILGFSTSTVSPTSLEWHKRGCDPHSIFKPINVANAVLEAYLARFRPVVHAEQNIITTNTFDDTALIADVISDMVAVGNASLVDSVNALVGEAMTEPETKTTTAGRKRLNKESTKLAAATTNKPHREESPSETPTETPSSIDV